MVTIKKKNTPAPVRQQATKARRTGANKPTPSSEYVVEEGSRSSKLVARGKDLLADEAGGVATAAAIVVGAALIEMELIPGLIIGAGAILLGKLFPEMSGYVRPVVKSAVRAGFSATQKIREVMAEASEQVHDLVAEVKKEQEHTSTKVKTTTSDSPVN